MSLAGQWRALENARFVPKQGDRRFLMLNISEIATRDLGVMYEWLKNNIISCRHVHQSGTGYVQGHQAQDRGDVAEDA